MKTIWKYDVIVGDFSHSMPIGAEFLSVQMQWTHPKMWWLVDPVADKEERHFCVLGTGHNVPNRFTSKDHLGTFQLQNGALVFHLFQNDRKS